MRKALIYLTLLLCCTPLWAQETGPQADTVVVPQGTIVPMKGAFLAPREQRDSILIGDQLLYGVELRLVEDGTQFAFPEW